MTKQDLAKQLAEKANINISVQQAADTIDTLMGIMYEAFIKGKNIYLRGFGTFKVAKLKPKVARNIGAGTAIQLPERTTVKFIPSKNLKHDMN